MLTTANLGILAEGVSSSTIGIIATIVVYLMIMIGIGFFFSRKGDKNAEDFYLGGRKLGPLVAAMSAEASDMSSWLLMGLPGVALINGIADASWTAIGLAVGTYLNWLFVASKLRRYSVKLNAITVPEYFSKRFHDKRNVLSLISALVIVIFFVPYTASGFSAVGKLVNTLFPQIDYHYAMIFGAAIIILYTVLGGFLAVSTTDLIQSIVMTIALAVIVFYGTSLAGGWNAVADNASNIAGYISLTSWNVDGVATDYSLLTICSTAAWGLGYFGMPHILLRFMAIRDEKEIKTSRRIASVWVVISMAVAILIGVIGNAAWKAGAIFKGVSAEDMDAEKVVIEFANLLSKNGILAAIVAGLVLAGILACTMSTADSQLLTAGSAISKNLFQDFFKVKMKDKVSMVIARAVIVVVAALAVVIAWNPDSSVFKIVSFAWAGFGGAFGAVVLFSLFWKRMNFVGALAGMVTGGATVFIWKFVVRVKFADTILNIYELLPAFIISSIFIIIGSLCTKKPDKTIIAEFDSVKSA